jgi:hypothetical protein
MCNAKNNRIFYKERRNPKALDITLEDKSAKKKFSIESLPSRKRSRPIQLRNSSINTELQCSFVHTGLTTAEI